jgi:hypothetical protein
VSKCHLQATKVKLLDGRDYTFRSLPLKPETAPIISAVLLGSVGDQGEVLRCLALALHKSLSYDQTPEEVDAILDLGLVPTIPGGADENIRQAVIRAVFAGFAN